LISAIPLIVINAGDSVVSLPFFENLNLGLFFPLVIIPLGILCTSVGFNTIAGYNGLEAGQGILIIGALSLIAFFTGSSWLALIGLCMVVSLLAFLFFNKYPASVFPGNSMTYSVGALIAIFAVLGNFERVAIVIFIPYILEVCLKLRGGLKMESFAKPNSDGSIDMRYDKIYGLEHAAIYVLKKIKSTVYERDVVYLIHLFQIIFIILGFLLFRDSIFI
jgi:UDP-N-acetylglucosamine--dolichyl-phosphate N-acetylglucosaminephosphotransferase